MVDLNRQLVWLFSLLMTGPFLSGCIENSYNEDLQFEVEANLDGLKVVEIYEETVLIETLSATMTFDFSSLQGQDIEEISLTVVITQSQQMSLLAMNGDRSITGRSWVVPNRCFAVSNELTTLKHSMLD